MFMCGEQTTHAQTMSPTISSKVYLKSARTSAPLGPSRTVRTSTSIGGTMSSTMKKMGRPAIASGPFGKRNESTYAYATS